jgi:hypothetical protein
MHLMRLQCCVRSTALTHHPQHKQGHSMHSMHSTACKAGPHLGLSCAAGSQGLQAHRRRCHGRLQGGHCWLVPLCCKQVYA